MLRPAGKDYLWGGVRLREEYNKDLELTPLAETWECSTHPDGPSVVVGTGMGLDEVLRYHPEWLGSKHHVEESVASDGGGITSGRDKIKPKAELPILIKLIDAAKDLSVQVHPDDDYARVHENQWGKTEMWYVLDAEPGAKLVYGFAHDVTRDQVLESLQKGTIEDYLQQIPVHPNDVFFVRPGTVHAIGGGVLLAEIQENSNVTYRLYDYDRVDKDGKKRPLHVEKALDVMDLKKAEEPHQKMRLMRYQPGSASEILCRCAYFQVDRVLVTEEYRMRVEETSFQVLLVLDGEMCVAGAKDDRKDICGVTGEKICASGQVGGEMTVRKGDCVFLPAGCGEIRVRGKGQLLQVFG